MCFKRGDAFVPVEEEYNSKRQQLGSALVRADHQTKQMESDLAAMVAVRDDVQAEYHAVVKDVKVRFRELKSMLELKESSMIAELDQVRTQKAKTLSKGATQIRENLEQVRNLCAAIVRLMDNERDPNVFLAETAIPESALRNILDGDGVQLPDVQVQCISFA